MEAVPGNIDRREKAAHHDRDGGAYAGAARRRAGELTEGCRMPDKEFDSLAFDIGFALRRKLFNRSLTTFFRGMPEDDLDDLCRRVADHLRRCNWKQGQPIGGFSYLFKTPEE